MRSWAGLALACALAGCATPQTQAPTASADAIAQESLAQQQYVINARIEESRRVETIYRRLGAANLEFCKHKTGSIGAGFHELSDYPKKFAGAAKAVGVPEAPTVAYVLDGYPAAEAGLRVGDQIVKVGGEELPPKAPGERQLRKAIAQASGAEPVKLSVLRAGAPLDLDVKPALTCGYPVLVVEDETVNAAANGKSVLLPRGMLNFVQSDQELALVLGHELAHNAMGHIDAREKNAMIGMLGGAVLDGLLMAATGVQSSAFMRAGSQAGAAAYSRQFETEADYVGLYFMARAGYDLSGAENFWRRMAAQSPKDITFANTHPTTAERFLVIAKTREEIAAKLAANEPLKPRMKGEEIAAAIAAPEAAPAAAAPAAPPVAPAAVAAAPAAQLATPAAAPAPLTP